MPPLRRIKAKTAKRRPFPVPGIRTTEPWVEIKAILEANDGERLQNMLESLQPGDLARALTRLDDDERLQLLTLLGPEEAADLVEELVDAHGADIIEDLPLGDAAVIVDEMESHHRADLLGEMDEDDAEAILRLMDPEEAEDARKLLEFDENTAGGIMITEYASYPLESTVHDVTSDLLANAEEYSDYGVQYAYVIAEHGGVVGVIRLRDLLLSPPERPVRKIMILNPVYVLADMPLDELSRFFDRYTFWVVPVTDAEGRMLGVVRRADVEEAMEEEQERTLLRFGGIIGGEELRSMPVRERASRRLLWLVLNMLLSVLAASVILGHQETVDQIFALVFFMPIICNMSGCSGNQAVAVSIRELALGLIKPKDYLRVWLHELAVGAINGVVLGFAIAVLGFALWHGNPWLGPVIGAAFALNTLVAVSLGGLIPMLLRGLGADPALGAPPILTTMTDMCGFLFVLGLAHWALSLGLLVGD